MKIKLIGGPANGYTLEVAENTVEHHQCENPKTWGKWGDHIYRKGDIAGEFNYVEESDPLAASLRARLAEEVERTVYLNERNDRFEQDFRTEEKENRKLEARIVELEAQLPPPTRTWKFSYRIPPDSEQVQDGAKCLQDHGFFDLGHAIKNAIEVTDG